MADTVRDSKDISWVSLRHKDWAAFADRALNQVLDIKDAIDLNKSQSYVEYLSLAKEQSLWRLSHEIQKWDGGHQFMSRGLIKIGVRSRIACLRQTIHD